jgi:hypothetical protein
MSSCSLTLTRSLALTDMAAKGTSLMKLGSDMRYRAMLLSYTQCRYVPPSIGDA